MIALQSLLDDSKCYETVRRLRWPDGVRCPHCGADEISKQGFDRPALRVTQKARQKYRCKGCGRHFDALTGTVFAGYGRLPQWGYAHRTVCHSAGEYARDADGDGFHEVHVNTIEGVWRPPRGHCCAPGCAPTAASRRRSCRSEASSRSCIMPDSAASACWNRCSRSC